MFSRNSNVASTERALINAFRILANMADRSRCYTGGFLIRWQDQLAQDHRGPSQPLVQEDQRWGSDEGQVQWGNRGGLPLYCMQVHFKKVHWCTFPLIKIIRILFRQEGVPRTFKEIVAVSTVNKRDIGRCFKIILKSHEDTKVGLVESGDFMSRHSICTVASGHFRMMKYIGKFPGFVACLGSRARFKELQLPLPKRCNWQIYIWGNRFIFALTKNRHKRQMTWSWRKGGLQSQWQLPQSTWQLRCFYT